MAYHRITDEEREKDSFGRFEIICERYLQGNEKTRQIILDALAPEERQTFLLGAGLYHLFRDQRLYDAVKNALGQLLWEEFHEEPKPRPQGIWKYVRLNYPSEAWPNEQIVVSHKTPEKNFTGYQDDPRVKAAVKAHDAGECEFLVWREIFEEE